MAAAFRIDTLKFVKRLTEGGLSREAAEAIAEGLNEADASDLATRADLAEVRTILQADLAEVRTELKAEIAEVRTELRTEIAAVRTSIADLRADLYGRLWVMGLGIVGLTVALMKLLPD